MKITVLDYGAGNVRSLINAVEKMGGSIKMVEKPEDILAAERLIFPGVGNYGAMLEILHGRGFVEHLEQRELARERGDEVGLVGLDGVGPGDDEGNEGGRTGPESGLVVCAQSFVFAGLVLGAADDAFIGQALGLDDLSVEGAVPALVCRGSIRRGRCGRPRL